MNQTAAGRRPPSRLARLAVIAGGLLLGAMLLAGGDKPGHAAVPEDDPFAGLDVLDAAEMAEKRGGFRDAALGIRLNLGANIRTAINGQLVLETLVKFAHNGATKIKHNMPPEINLPQLTFLAADGQPIAGIASQNTVGPVTFEANGSQITVPAGFEGLVAQSDTGVVAAVSNVTKAQFANLVINTDPLVKVEQILDIQINVQGFATLQENIKLNTNFINIREALRAASLGALGAN